MSSLKGVSDYLLDRYKKLAYVSMPKSVRRDYELECLGDLPKAPYENIEPGVLLSDRIQYFAGRYKLIEPFNTGKLKPAAYELSVGALYSIGGKTCRLSDEPGENEIVIPPFEVVIIQTLERLNLPDFLIARWNVRVKWAYKGLLWVGAAQVDPGFKGFLACPLYNLSDSKVRLHFGDEIAVIDFVATTSPISQPESQRYKPLKRTRILFEDYAPDELRSALATQAHKKILSFEKEIRELRSRIESMVGVIFTAIAVLVAAVAIFATKAQPPDIANFTPALLVGTVAVFIALFSYAHSTYRHILADGEKKVVFWVGQVVALALLILLIVQSFRIAPWHWNDKPAQTTVEPAK